MHLIVRVETVHVCLRERVRCSHKVNSSVCASAATKMFRWHRTCRNVQTCDAPHSKHVGGGAAMIEERGENSPLSCET